MNDLRLSARILASFLPGLLCFGQATELFDAARRGDLAKLRTLVRNGANVNERGPSGGTALHEAAANCQVEASQMLIISGWDPHARDDRGSTPVELSIKCLEAKSKAVQGAVGAVSETPWSLQYAAAHKQTGVISMLLKMGVDVNAAGSDGNRALDIACLKGDAASVQILLEHGANPNLRKRDGSAPLHDAALNGSKAVIELLLAHGAEVNAQDTESKSTPLHYAASFGRLEAVKTLVDRGADVSLRNAKGQTALQLAVADNREDVSGFLRTNAPAK